MKILMIAPTPFFADRGCHTQIYEEIKALQKLNHEIILCTYGIGRDIEGVSTVRCPNLPWYSKLSAGPSYTKILLLPILTITVIKKIRSFRPDIIHSHLHEGAIIGKICSLFFRKPKYLFDMQGSLTGEIAQHGFVKKESFAFKFFKKLEKMIANWQFVITQSDSMIDELIDFGVLNKECENVKDGVDTEIFKPMPFCNRIAEQIKIEESDPRLIYMGLLEAYQGVDIMFEALSIVHLAKPNAKFIIIGYPNEDKYKDICREIGIEEATRFLGRIDYSKVPEYLSLANIAIAPKISETEGDGKIYNYMAMGMATVAFDRSVAREILGECGIFAKYADAEDLAAKILWSLDNEKESIDLGAKARLRAIQNLSWDAVGKRINNVYERLNKMEKVNVL